MKRRILSIVTVLALCLSLCPTWAFAVESEIVPDDEVLADDLCTHGELVDECPLCPIDALIAALPRALTEDNAETVRWQLDEILDLWRELSEDEQGQIDMTLCSDLQAALDEANVPVTADGHAEQQADDEAKVDIGGNITYYSTLGEAFSAANGKNATITMLTNAECTSSDFNNPSPLVISGGIVTLDMNGKTLSGEGYGTGGIIGISGGSLAVQGNGTVEVRYSGMICTGGTLTVADTTFNLVGPGYGSAACAIQNGSQDTGKGGTVIINGGTITGAASDDYGQIFHYAGTTIINNVTTKDGTRGVFFQNDGKSSGKLTINGGTFNNTITVDPSDEGIQSVEALLGNGYAYKHQGGTWATDNEVAGLSISNVTVEKIPLTINPQADTSWYYNSDAHSLQMNAVPVTEGATITYEWYDGSTKLDCTADAYPVPKTMAVGNYTYTCNATCDGYTLSHKFTFTVEACPHTGLVYESQENNKHGGTCPDCGEVVSEEHTWVDGVCSACNLKAVAQVEIGNATTYYGGIDAALTAASGKTATITLLADVTHPYMRSISDDSNNITLNGGDYTLSIQGFMVSGGQLDISSGTFKFAAALMVSGGTVRLSGGEFINTNGQEAISCTPGSNLTVGDFLLNYGSTNAAEKHYAYYQNGQPIEMTGQTSLSGTVKVDECKHDTSVREYRHNDGTQTHTLTCLACGYTEGAEDCSYGDEYQYDDTYHWNTCTACGYENKVAHSWMFSYNSTGNVTENYQLCISCRHTKDYLTLTITVPTGLTYGDTGGKQVTYTLSPDKTCDKVNWKFTGGGPEFADGILPANLSVGEHWFRVMGLMSDETVVFSGSYYLTVSAAPLTRDMVTLSPESATYSGTEQKPAVTVKQGETPLAEGTDYDVAYSTTDFTSAGTITVTITGKGNYTGEVEKTYTIAKANPTIAWSNTSQELTYTGQPAAITAPTVTLANSENFSGTIKYSYAVGDSTSYTSGLPTDAGTYTIKASVDAEGNYAAADSTNTLTLTIKQAKVTITWGNDAQTTTYTGKPAEITAPTVSAENGLTVSVTPEYSYKAENESTFTNGLPTNAGTYTVRASIAASDNLTAASEDMTLTISKVTLSISGAAVDLKTYDGSTTAIVSSMTFSGLVNGEELTKGTDYTATGAFGTADAGENKSVNVTVTLSAESSTAKNYTLTSNTFATTGKIEKADSTITTPPTAAGITYGQALSDSILSGGVGSVAGAFAWTDGTAKPSAGTAQYSVTFTPTDEVNYNTATANVSVTVAKATPTITWGNETQTMGYTGSAAAITAPTVTLVNGENFGGTISYSYSTGDSTVYTSGLPTNAGIYKVKAKIAEQGNYIAAESGEMTLTISKVNYTGATTANTSAKFGTTATYDLAALLPDESTAGTPTTASDIFDGTPSVSGKTLTYKLKAGAVVDSTGTITVPVTTTNYNDFSLTITVTVKNKDVPTLTVSPVTVTYTGEAVSDSAIRGTAKVGETTVPGNWSFAVGQSLTNVADSGTKTVIFTPNDSQNYETATASVSVTINKATPELTLTPSPATLPNGGTVTLTLTGLPTGGTATVSCDHETISVTNESGNTWTAELPAGGASYTFTASYAGDGNHNSATANCTVRVEKITPTLRLTADPASLTGGGTVTLTLSGLPVGGTATVTCSGSITVTAGANNTWTADLPNSTATYTFTASYGGDTSYNAANASCTVATTEVAVLPDTPTGDNGETLRLVMEDGISEVPEALKKITSPVED